MVSTRRPFSFAAAAPALLLGVAAAGVLASPESLLRRFAELGGTPAENLRLMQGFGVALAMLAAATLIDARRPPRAAGPLAAAALAAAAAATLVLFVLRLADWWIDDAGITFAYSRSLAEGEGLRAQPGAPAVEGYSSTLWMLILAAAGRLGADIPAAAKMLGMVFGVAALALAVDLVRRETGSAQAAALAACAICTAPFAVWTASGQEHALQALLLTLVVVLAARLEAWRPWTAGLLCLLVLTRPEAPLIVAAVFVAGLALSWREGRGLDLRRNLPLALAPFLVFAALVAFRLAYFGDLLPNPFYAKASDAGPAGLLNLFGGGWSYLLQGLQATGLILLAPLLALGPGPGAGTGARTARRAALPAAAAVLGGHLVFVVWAKGDWMGQYRFLMPVLPLLAAAPLLAAGAIPPGLRRTALCLGAGLFLLQSTIVQLSLFAAGPTTPLATVAAVGREFADLARRLEIPDPTLAHHDAGAIAYERSLRLIDLGGLIDRRIARSMGDRAALEAYLLEERRPDFFFGGRNFAARSGFAEGPAFARDYVRLDFVGKPFMKSHLTHIRRDRIRPAPGIRIERDAEGRATRVEVGPRPDGS